MASAAQPVDGIQLASARRAITILERLCRQSLMETVGCSEPDANARLEAELGYYRRLRLDTLSMKDVFRRYCISLANRSPLFSLVFENMEQCDARIVAYSEVFCDYSPRDLVAKYRGCEEELLSRLIEKRGLTPQQAKRQRDAPRAMLPTYLQGLLAGAEYFARFEDGCEFARFVGKWLVDPDLVAMLPQYFQALGFPGFGAALAADFLKEMGVRELGKPDRWVRRCMATAGWIEEDCSDFRVQRVFWKLWKLLGDEYPPSILDKLMYLVGTGNFVMVVPQYECKPQYPTFEQAILQSRDCD